MNAFATLRRQANVQATDLAGQLGVSEDSVEAWETGRRAVPEHVMRSLRLISALEPASETIEVEPLVGVPETQNCLFGDELPVLSAKAARTGSFIDNMKLPVHRWFRYSAGFSAEWVEALIAERCANRSGGLVFDPFAGSGTALLAAAKCGVPSAGAERHSFVHRIAEAKLNAGGDVSTLRAEARDLIATARRCDSGPPAVEAPLLAKCYSPEALLKLQALRATYLSSYSGQSANAALLWLAITSVLRECSGVGTAQWQYVLPNKAKAKVADPYRAFERRIEMFCSDLCEVARDNSDAAMTRLEKDDARSLASFADLEGQVTFAVTSPPYPNNYDYADATRLEMTFWGEVRSWGDLHKTVRHELVRSCSQHSSADKLLLPELLSDPLIDPIIDQLSKVTSELESIRATKGGRKTYHTMIAAYFADLARVWRALRPLCADGADVCFVVGDSAPYGVHVPVEDWLASLAVSAGFHSPRFEKTRDRNIKWKNRKHRVPLKEGNLWLKA